MGIREIRFRNSLKESALWNILAQIGAALAATVTLRECEIAHLWPVLATVSPAPRRPAIAETVRGLSPCFQVGKSSPALSGVSGMALITTPRRRPSNRVAGRSLSNRRGPSRQTSAACRLAPGSNPTVGFLAAHRVSLLWPGRPVASQTSIHTFALVIDRWKSCLGRRAERHSDAGGVSLARIIAIGGNLGGV